METWLVVYATVTYALLYGMPNSEFTQKISRQAAMESLSNSVTASA